jgi:hypothetical protein
LLILAKICTGKPALPPNQTGVPPWELQQQESLQTKGYPYLPFATPETAKPGKP